MFATEVLIVDTLLSILALAFSNVDPNPDVSDFNFLSSSEVSTNDLFNATTCLDIPEISSLKTLVAADPCEIYPSSKLTLSKSCEHSCAGR